MGNLRPQIIGAMLCLFCATVAHAQQPQLTVTVPKLVRFSGSFHPGNGGPVEPMESVTLSVYRDQSGGDALWHEIQNVVVDADGHYSVLMGAAQNEGMPLDLFTSGEPRWLSVRFNRAGEAEQPRVLLVSVPYALKAADADTLGGKPASAYLLAAPTAGANAGRESGVTATTAVKPKATPANSGVPNYIGKFANTTDLVDSAMYEVNGNVGIFTTQPAISLDVRTGSLPQMGIAGTTDYLTFFASDQFGPAIYWDPAKDMRFGKGGSGLYNPFGFVEQMRIKSSNGNVGIGTQTPASKLDVAGDINFSGSVLYKGSPMLQVPGGLTNNVALGIGTSAGNTTGNFNMATGAYALHSNTSGFENTASGYASMYFNDAGYSNTATGATALQGNTTGFYNTASGSAALYHNTIGSENAASGYQAMLDNTSGTDNTADGPYALQSNTTGSFNTAIGDVALASNTTGNSNIAIGAGAAVNVSGGASENIHIGSPGSAEDTGTIRIGFPGVQSRFFVVGVRGITTGSNNAVPVVIDSNGQLGTASSSRRFKEDVADMGGASHNLMRLRPVTYRYKEPFADGSKPIQYGLIAEEVAEVYPELVAHSADGQIETVKYQVLDSMLLNEVQRQQAEIAAQKAQLEGLIQHVEEQRQQIDEQRDQNQSLKERLARLETLLPPMSRIPSVQ